MKKNLNNKNLRYQRIFLFTAAIICIVILVNISLIYAKANDDFNQQEKAKPGVFSGETLFKIKHGASHDAVLSPSAIAIDKDKNVLICDAGGTKIIKIDTKEKKSSILFNYGKTEIGSNFVSDMTVSQSGYVYLADAEKNLIYKFSEDGTKEGIIGEDNGRKLIKKIKHIFTDKQSNLIAVDSLDRKIAIFNEEMKLKKEIRLPISNLIFSYVCGSDDSNCVYISNLINNVFHVINASDVNHPIYSHKCSLDEVGGKIADCYVIGFDEKNNAYVKAYLVDKDGKEAGHYLAKFDAVKRTILKMKISSKANKGDIKFGKPFAVMGENKILSFEDDGKEFKLITFEL